MKTIQTMALAALIAFMTACGQSKAPTSGENAAANGVPTANCSYKFEERAKDDFAQGEKTDRVYSIYVEGADQENVATCKAELEKVAQTKEAGKGGVTKVFFFNCPHHTPSVTTGEKKTICAEKFFVDKEMYPYCVGAVEIDPQGKTTFVEQPFSL